MAACVLLTAGWAWLVWRFTEGLAAAIIPTLIVDFNVNQEMQHWNPIFRLKWLGWRPFCCNMMTSSNGNIFRVTGHLCGEFTGPGEFPTQRPTARSFDVFFDLRLNKQLSKQWWGWWFDTPSCPLWRHYNDFSPHGSIYLSMRLAEVNCACKRCSEPSTTNTTNGCIF